MNFKHARSGAFGPSPGSSQGRPRMTYPPEYDHPPVYRPGWIVWATVAAWVAAVIAFLAYLGPSAYGSQ